MSLLEMFDMTWTYPNPNDVLFTISVTVIVMIAMSYVRSTDIHILDEFKAAVIKRLF